MVIHCGERAGNETARSLRWASRPHIWSPWDGFNKYQFGLTKGRTATKVCRVLDPSSYRATNPSLGAKHTTIQGMRRAKSLTEAGKPMSTLTVRGLGISDEAAVTRVSPKRPCRSPLRYQSSPGMRRSRNLDAPKNTYSNLSGHGQSHPA